MLASPRRPARQEEDKPECPHVQLCQGKAVLSCAVDLLTVINDRMNPQCPWSFKKDFRIHTSGSWRLY